MRFMSDTDLLFAQTRFIRANKPNRLALVLVVDHLRKWADSVSDGWHSWPKPCRAAEQAIRLIESTTNRANDEQEREDITDAQMQAAVRPIKSFLTRMAKERHGLYPDRAMVTAEEREIILRAVTE